MHVLFLHPSFPGHFRDIVQHLAREGWSISFATAQHQGEIEGIEKIPYTRRGGAGPANHLFARAFENAVGHAHGAYEALKDRRDLRPDLIIAHSGLGSSLFLPHLNDAPIINFFEYFHHPAGQRLGFRPDAPVAEADLLGARTRNAMTLLDLENCERGWSPTAFQRDLFPRAYRDKIEVHPLGVDTRLFRPRPAGEVRAALGLGTSTRLITYISRGLERLRGFDLFIEAAKRIALQYPDVRFAIAGGDVPAYGDDRRFTAGKTLRQQLLEQERLDPAKFHFAGLLPRRAVADLLAASDLHLSLTEPFVAPRSLLEALASGCIVLASDQPSVREFIAHRETGLLCDFFDVEDLARQAVEVLRDPAAFRPLGQAARRTVEERYALDVTLPQLKDFFERSAARPRPLSLRAELLVREGTDHVGGHDPLDDDPVETTAGPATDTTADENVPTSVHSPDEVVAQLTRLAAEPRTPAQWVEFVQGFRGVGSLEKLGPRNHPEDLIRLLTRLIQWKPSLILDLGADVGRMLLWSRAARPDARLIAAPLPGALLDPDRIRAIESLAIAQQNIACIPTAPDRAALAARVDQQCAGRDIDFLFMDGLRPFDQLRADFRHYRNRVRRGGLIAWDGVDPILPPDAARDGGARLWAELKPMYPFRAEYLAGSRTTFGGIAMVRI